MKTREITNDEINKIIEKCPPRERAFFTTIKQSGLTPLAIKKLRVRDVEGILERDTPTPCKINTPNGEFPTFIGEEAVKYIKGYLHTRRSITPESPLFTKRNNPNKQINTKSVSRAFKLAVKKTKTKKPSELKLYNLVTFYKRNTKEFRKQLANKTKSSSEYHRELYEKEAMPSLETEPLTPIRRLETQNKQLTQRLTEIENKLLPEEIPPELQEQMEKEHEEWEKWEKEHGEEERKAWEERQRQHEEWLKEHPEEARREEEQMKTMIEENEEFYVYSLEERVKELTAKLKELTDIISKHKKTRHFSQKDIGK